MKPNLKSKSDLNLVSELKSLVAKERELLTQILNYLKEIDIRKLYLLRGFSSLFAFMTEEIGYSESAAQRRIQAMRLIRDLPEVEAKIEKGEISLSVASQVQNFFFKETQKRKEKQQQGMGREEKLELVQQLEGSSARRCEQKLAQIAPETCLPKEKTRALNTEKVLIQFIADQNLLNSIDRLKSLLSHENPEGSYEKLFIKLTEIALEKLDPHRRQFRRKKQKGVQIPEEKCTGLLPTSEVKPSRKNRHIPRPLKDQVWVRDQGRCQYRDQMTGKVCGSRHELELDHRFPFSLGGEHTEENLHLLCRRHNLYRAEILF